MYQRCCSLLFKAGPITISAFEFIQVRNERNKTREDCRQLRSKLEVVVKECTGLKREKQDLITEIDKLKAEVELNSIRVRTHWDKSRNLCSESIGKFIPSFHQCRSNVSHYSDV